MVEKDKFRSKAKVWVEKRGENARAVRKVGRTNSSLSRDSCEHLMCGTKGERWGRVVFSEASQHVD